MTISKDDIWQYLEDVKDPEIPVISLVELGVITSVEITEEGAATIGLTPTFSGCPAINYMKDDIVETLQQKGIDNVTVNISFKDSWNSNKISESGRKKLKTFGLAPPPKHDLIIDIDILSHIECPYCNSKNTIMKSPFGPTLCRSLHYCNNCQQAFEQFKPI